MYFLNDLSCHQAREQIGQKWCIAVYQMRKDLKSGRDLPRKNCYTVQIFPNISVNLNGVTTQ